MERLTNPRIGRRISIFFSFLFFIDDKGNVNLKIFKTLIETKSEPVETYKKNASRR